MCMYYFNHFYLFLKYFLLIILLQYFQIFSLYPPSTVPHQPSSITTPHFMSMGCTYKFFEFSVSYTIFDISPSILCLPIILLIPCTSPHSRFLPSPSPLKTLHEISISLVLSCYSCLLSFCFCFLNSVVDTYEFVVILLFIVLDFVFLG